jgi:hypothetical protein
MTKTMPTDSGVSFWIASRVAVCFNLVHKVTEAIQKSAHGRTGGGGVVYAWTTSSEASRAPPPRIGAPAESSPTPGSARQRARPQLLARIQPSPAIPEQQASSVRHHQKIGESRRDALLYSCMRAAQQARDRST